MEAVQQWLKELVNITDEELAFINDITETTTANANEVVIKQGQIANRIGLLLQGALRSYAIDNDGNEKTLRFTFEGQPLIVMDSFFVQVPSTLTSVTLEPAVIIWTDYERYSAFVNKFPRYNLVFIEGLAKWFAKDKARLDYLNQSTAKAKYDKMCQSDPKIIQRVPLKYIASYLGITQETLSRVRGKK